MGAKSVHKLAHDSQQQRRPLRSEQLKQYEQRQPHPPAALHPHERRPEQFHLLSQCRSALPRSHFSFHSKTSR